MTIPAELDESNLELLLDEELRSAVEPLMRRPNPTMSMAEAIALLTPEQKAAANARAQMIRDMAPEERHARAQAVVAAFQIAKDLAQ